MSIAPRVMPRNPTWCRRRLEASVQPLTTRLIQALGHRLGQPEIILSGTNLVLLSAVVGGSCHLRANALWNSILVVSLPFIAI
jgi:hypothetical protein